MKRAGRRSTQPAWTRADTRSLLRMRLCDLGLTLSGSPVASRIEQVLEEIGDRGLKFRPHFWISDEWFTPGGVTGVAIPFYLTHPRLMRLERSMMLAAEGSSHRECMMILRHEVGHAIDHAFHLSRTKDWKRHFGRTTARYPITYRPRPTSRNHVQHLASWYAQAHPDEDFAETFAVWLTPRSNWQRRYEGWPALRKLEYVDSLMKTIGRRRPAKINRRMVDPISAMTRTLAEYYEKKQRRYGTNYPDFYDADLTRLFSDSPDDRWRESAAVFVRRIAPDLRRRIAFWTGESQYTLAQVIHEIIGRCQELNLRVAGDPGRIRINLGIVLTMHTMTFLHSRPRRLTL